MNRYNFRSDQEFKQYFPNREGDDRVSPGLGLRDPFENCKNMERDFRLSPSIPSSLVSSTHDNIRDRFGASSVMLNPSYFNLSYENHRHLTSTNNTLNQKLEENNAENNMEKMKFHKNQQYLQKSFE